MEEIWRDIKGYEGLYQISNLGRVRSLDRTIQTIGKNQYGIYPVIKIYKGQIISQPINQKGYHQISLRKDGKKSNKLVHQLIAQAFIPNPENKATVNHIDGNRANNSLDNLEWASAKEQQIHRIYVLGHKSIIGEECRAARKYSQQKKVERSDGAIFNSIKEASNGDESLRKHISDVCNGKRHTAGGYSWKYIDKI